MLKNLSRWIGPDPAGEDEETRPEASTFEFDDSEAIRDHFLIRMLNKPRLVIGLAASLCVMATVTYIGLGFFWLSGSPSPEEAVAMAGVEEAVAGPEKAEETEKAASSVDAIAKDANVSVKKIDATEILAMAGIADETSEPPAGAAGRPDPFAPLVTPPVDTGSGSAAVPDIDEGPRDPLEFLQYTGYIGELKSKDKVAIIRISDGIQSDYTVIKKAGETFTVNGEVVTLKSIGPEALHLKIAGASRRLDLNPYVEISAASGSGSSSGSGAAAPSGGGGGASGGSSSGGSSGGPSGDPTNPTLAEPGSH